MTNDPAARDEAKTYSKALEVAAFRHEQMEAEITRLRAESEQLKANITAQDEKIMWWLRSDIAAQATISCLRAELTASAGPCGHPECRRLVAELAERVRGIAARAAQRAREASK